MPGFLFCFCFFDLSWRPALAALCRIPDPLAVRFYNPFPLAASFLRGSIRCLHVLDCPLPLPLEWPLYRAGVSLYCTSTDHQSLECWRVNHPFILLCMFMQQIVIVCLCCVKHCSLSSFRVLWFLSLAFHCPNPLSFELHAWPVFWALSRARPP